eukprot:CAMPEP_0194438880 /NCGR_PEP_ID=MMETSP0176-20130528/107291_1 /TAXON_ID=216777 /ORGANISM="Proboscia alata, Strain PI-D3" /LENGTH=81 /DNA_ID=CAMNT_0039261475 /DNA_START=136 /DNA_END=377 /DNA_ORIENTATION=+
MGSVISSSQQVVVGIRAVLLGSNVPAAINPPRSDADSSFQLTVSNRGQTPDDGTLKSPEDGTMVSSMQLLLGLEVSGMISA